MSNTVNVGMLGAGFIGQVHSIALYNIPIIRYKEKLIPKMVAIADQDIKLADSIAERYGWLNTYDSWQDIVNNDDIDLFINAAPNYLHVEPTIAAAKKGKHVLCEKPIAVNADEAYKVWKEVAETGVKHMAAFVWRAFPPLRLIKEMVDAGEFGEVIHFRSNFLLPQFEPDKPMPWRFSKKLAGAGALGDMASHHIDIARYIVGEVVRVGAITKQVTKDPAGKIFDINEDVAVCAAEFDNGATAIFEASRIAYAHGLTGRVEVDGTKRSATFHYEKINELNILEPGKGVNTIIVNKPGQPFADFWVPAGKQGSHPHGLNDCFAHQDYKIIAAIKGLETIEPHGATFKDGYHVSEIIDTIERSAIEGKFLNVKFRNI